MTEGAFRFFDEATLRKLEQLTLVADKVRVGVLKGNRQSRRRGASIEFADYRNYAQGDDLRRLDWNALARLGRSFIKLTEDEEDLAVHLLLDASTSMDWPSKLADLDRNSPVTADHDRHKFVYGLRLAGALGHIALNTGDLVTATLLDGTGASGWGPFRGQQNSWRMLEYLEAQANQVARRSDSARVLTDINVSLRDYALRARRPGLLVLLSDMLSPAGYLDGFAALQSRGYEVGLIHILSPDEVAPEFSGDLRLVDAETGQAAELTLDPFVIEAYVERFAAWQQAIATTCYQRQIRYIPVTTDIPWDRFLLQMMPERSFIS